ncbi:uncharacterized protein [Penaeus vannamei]|uniref:uncharacterized protein n=1 Tax=Penaeus vannamei TaxID=6689 RepID=UPI00387F5015
MLRTVNDYVASCQACQRRKGPAYRASLAAAFQTTLPLEKISANLLELDTTAEGNRYVLSLVDHDSRYLQLIALPSKDASTVTEAFLRHFVTLLMVKNALAPLLETFPHEWDELLPYVRLAVHTAVHRSTEQPLDFLMGHHGTFPQVNTNYMEVDPEAAGAYVQRL